MRKINAFIFICFYLFMTKVVFAATVEMDGKKINCDQTSPMFYYCGEGSKKFIVNYSAVGWGAFSKESDGVVSLKPISKLVDNNKVLFQSNNVKPYEDTLYNRKIAADNIVYSLGFKKDDLSKSLVSEARKFQSSFNGAIPKVTMTLNGSGESYQCTKGDTRALTSKQLKNQTEYDAVYNCPYYSCSGKDPAEKILMVLPKPGTVYTAPSTLIMKNGQAKLIEGGYKITNGSSLTVANFPKGYNSSSDDDDFPGMPPADLNPDLLIPSKYNDSKSSYKYLLDMAKKDFSDSNMDYCSGTAVKALDDERKKIGNGMLAYLSDAEIIEYLKVIDGSIHSYYVDRKKGESLGCMYQNKIIDSSVLGQFDHLKDISTIKTTGKYLKPDEVQDLFKKAKNMKDIPFDYKYDGCYARAHIMSQRFEAMGIPTQKVWIKGKLFVPGTDIEWQYHVAPTVEVKEKNGKIVNYVIDPSLTDKAVTVDEWVATMGRKAPGPIMKTTYPFPGNSLDFQRTTVAISPDDVFAPEDIQGMSAQDKMDFATQKLKEFSEVLASQGPGKR